MDDIRWKAFWHYLFFALFCLAIWGVSNGVIALIVFCIGLTLYLAFHLHWIHQLDSWLEKPDLGKIPNGSANWENTFSALYQEQRRLSRNQSQLSATLGRFRHAASALPDGVVILNAQNEIEWCNKPAEIKLGLNLNQDTQQPISYLIRQSEFLSYLQLKDHSESIKLKSWLSDDILELQLVNYGSKQKLLICRDVTQLEKIDAMRRDFIANVSHELRTPLTVVGGFLETLLDMDGAIPSNTRHYFNMMQDQTMRMKLLIDDLLVLSKIESNAQAPENDTINMSDLINILCNDAKILSQGKHSMQIEISPNLNLVGATREIQSAFSNILSNAIRYSPDGGNIIISWKLQDNNAIFSVSDSGIGIEPQHLERLTERFYRVDSGRSRLTGGTGLGLSIVKHILTRHQARLNVHSEFGQGSTFSAVFPVSRILSNP